MPKTTDKKQVRVHKKLTSKDLKSIEDMGAEANTWNDIALELGWKPDTLQRKDAAKEAYDLGAARCRKSIRKKQYDLAMNGNANMLTWLGKILCDQKEVQHIETNVDGPSFVSIGAFKGSDE